MAQPHDPPADQLERLSARLDVLIRDVRLGTRTHRAFEANCDEAEQISIGLRAVFRGETAPGTRCLGHQGTGAWF